MKTIWKSIKTFFWMLSLIFVYPYALLKFLKVKKRGKKYKKYHYDYLVEERYQEVYKLSKLALYIKRANKYEFFEKEKISPKPQLIVVNHRSLLDPVILFNFLYQQLTNNFIFVAKKELATTKLGPILDYIDTIYLDRNNPREALKTIEDEKQAIKQQKVVVIFPEGTRNDQDELLDFKSGAFEPAYKTMCPIQPILLFATDQYLEKKKEYKHNRKTIKVVILEDIKPAAFISIDRIIFAKNIKKIMQDKYNQIINTQK